MQKRLAETTLQKAAIEGWIRVVKLLLDRGADPNQRIICDGPCIKLSPHCCGHCKKAYGVALSWTPLHAAIVYLYDDPQIAKEMTQLLLSKGATSEGVDSELRFYNYQEPGNPCIHKATPIQLSGGGLVKEVLLQHSKSTEQQATPYPFISRCYRCHGQF